MGITPTEAEMIEAAITSALIDVHVSLPGKIESYDALTQTATVQLQVKRVLPKAGGGFVTEDLPVLENVPVQFPRTKKFIVTLPIESGDYGLVVFSEMSIDQWRSKGENTSPGDIGRHTLTGGVFQPGLSPVLETILPSVLLGGADISENLVIGLLGDNAQIHITPSGSVLIGADATLQAARRTDPVEAIIPAGTVVISAANAVLNPADIVLDGEITDGSGTVRISD